ncbi:unnamed protein product [Protopolystoma xenopodis]|uniref:Uncharacterized protein n=1 Tax=Protopolystoma xenopodis TaxID=117903 RepID=A0A448WXL5_9PLAT|nr:unnamed protein product [Protopolystoma xenopodis]
MLVRLSGDLGLPEAQDYMTRLRRVEKLKEARDQRQLSASSRRTAFLAGPTAGSRENSASASSGGADSREGSASLLRQQNPLASVGLGRAHGLTQNSGQAGSLFSSDTSSSGTYASSAIGANLGGTQGLSSTIGGLAPQGHSGVLNGGNYGGVGYGNRDAPGLSGNNEEMDENRKLYMGDKGDLIYSDPLGPSSERPRTAVRSRSQQDDFAEDEVDDNLLPE